MNDKQWIKWMEIGRRMGCHQMPERSFFANGYQFPVCARCTGVILAQIFAVPFYFLVRLPMKACIAMMGIMFADWYIQHIGIKESNNRRRYITGLIGGFGYMTAILHLYRYIFVILSHMYENFKY